MNERQRQELAKTRPAPAAEPRRMVATSRVMYLSRTKGRTLAETGDVVDPVDLDLEFMLEHNLVGDE